MIYISNMLKIFRHFCRSILRLYNFGIAKRNCILREVCSGKNLALSSQIYKLGSRLKFRCRILSTQHSSLKTFNDQNCCTTFRCQMIIVRINAVSLYKSIAMTDLFIIFIHINSLSKSRWLYLLTHHNTFCSNYVYYPVWDRKFDLIFCIS